MGKDAIRLNSPTINEFCGSGQYEYKRDGFVKVDVAMPPSTTMVDHLLSNDSGKNLFPGMTNLNRPVGE